MSLEEEIHANTLALHALTERIAVSLGAGALAPAAEKPAKKAPAVKAVEPEPEAGGGFLDEPEPELDEKQLRAMAQKVAVELGKTKGQEAIKELGAKYGSKLSAIPADKLPGFIEDVNAALAS